MRKFRIKAILRTNRKTGNGKLSAADPKEGDHGVFTDLINDLADNTFEETNNENSRIFFLNAINQYESKLYREFNE